MMFAFAALNQNKKQRKFAGFVHATNKKEAQKWLDKNRKGFKIYGHGLPLEFNGRPKERNNRRKKVSKKVSLIGW